MYSTCSFSVNIMYGKMTEWRQNEMFKYLVVLQEDTSLWNSRLRTAKISFLFSQNYDFQALLISVFTVFWSPGWFTLWKEYLCLLSGRLSGSQSLSGHSWRRSNRFSFNGKYIIQYRRSGGRWSMKCAFLLQFFYKANVGLCVNAELNKEYYTYSQVQ
jgi:hypothetical protein